MALYRLFQRLVTIAVVIGVVISAGGSDIFAGDGPYDPAQAPQQTALRRFESDDPLVQREGSWTLQTAAGASAGSYLYNAGSVDDVLTFQFVGTTLEVVYTAAPNLGFLAIEVDGTVQRTVPTNNTPPLYQQISSVDYLSNTVHTARIYGADGDLVAVDAFQVLDLFGGTGVTCPSALTIPYEDITAFRNAINLANSDPDVTTICLEGGYTFTNAATGVNALPIITTAIIIEGNGVTLTRSGINNLRFYEIATTGRLTLRDQILLSGSVTGNGGGILNNGGSLTLDNVWLHMGHANGNGAGIYSNGGSLQIGGSTFASNTATNGAGLYTTANTTTTITHTTFADNSATQDGGALSNGGTLTVVLGGFANNSAGRYGGAIHNLGTATLNASIFDANTAVTRGGAINNQGTLTLTGNTLVYHNTATGGTASGGGVYNATGSQLTLRYTVVTENTAANGGGVRSEGTLAIEGNTEFTLNQATQQGGALYIGDGTVTITNTRILSNTAGTNGGAIFNASTTDSLSFSDSLVQENYAATRGGGFYSAGPLAIERANLHSNGAGTQGGGIYLTATSNASAHTSCIVENSTPNAVHNAGTTARSFTHNWWGASDGPSGAAPGSGDAVSTYITYTDFLSTDSPCASTLPPLPPTLSCQSWQDGLAYGWTDSSSGGPYVVWDTHGMYGNASGSGTWTVSAYYDVSSLTPAADTWYFRFTDNGLGDGYEVYQGPAAPAPGTILGSLVAQNPDGFYNITEDFVQVVWSVETPLNLSQSLQFFSFCSTTQPPIPNQGPIVTAGPDQVLLIPDYQAQLSGNVFDADGLPGTGTTSHWELVSGPGTVAFEPHPTGNTAVSDAEDPTVTFSTTGVYVLRLTGSDGLLSATDDVTLVVSDDIDLTVQSLETTAFEVDRRTLEVSGTLSAQVANLGEASTSIEFTLIFFEDVATQNDPLNGVYDLGVDHIVAQTQVQALAGGASVVVTAPATGEVSFAGIPIHAFVDSTLAITETNEANNVLSSIGQCVLAGPTPFVAPTLVQQWLGSSTASDSANVVMTPAVADLNLDGQSDIIFISSTGLPPGGDATLRAITWNDSGINANELFSLGIGELSINHIAVGNISGDAHPEILATSELGELVAFAYSEQTSQYAEIWRTDGGGEAPALADLDEDGLPEIVTSFGILDHNGNLLQVLGVVNLGDPLRYESGVPLVADLDMEGAPEIISGNLVYRANGQTVYWHYPNLDGIGGNNWAKYAAVADLDEDAYPEVVIVSHFTRSLYVFEHDGTRMVNGVPQIAPKWGPIEMPIGSGGGAPVIADVDGDGDAEIGVAGYSGLVVYETVVDPNTQQLTLQVKWQFATQDFSSNLTSASAFDFNNDGRSEIVYGDEINLYIFGAADPSGATGTVLWQTPSQNGTSLEYPVVADVNGDGTAEIIKVSTGATGVRGVWVYGNALWPPTRAIWNQYSYHITNVNDDGSIPQIEANNWTTYNNYHENPVLSTCENPRRDVTVSGIHRDINNRQILYARVGNAGNVVTPANIGLGFYNGDPENGGTLITTLTLTNALNPGEYEALTWTVPAGTDALPLWVWVDNGEVFAEGPAQGSTNPYEANNIDNTGLYFTATPNTAPAVDAGPATVTILPGETLNLTGTATDADNLPIGVLEHTWTVTAAPEGGHATIADPSALVTTVQFTGRGVYTLRLTATDLDLPSWDDIEVTVSPLPPAQTPGLIGSPANGSSLTGLVPITLLEGATITNATLEMWPAYNPNAVTTLASNLSANGGETLATLDTTRLSNDSYFIRLVGVDGTSQETHSVIMVTAVGENKPGRVKFTVTDLVVPVSGLPITIGRTYDSLERNLSGDFGYGWSLAIGNPRLEIDGHQNVTLTLPDGRRTTFYFTPQPMGLVFAQPHYTPEPGVYGSLTVPDCLLVSGGETGYICFLEGPFEPQTYTYTDPYGRVFTLDADGTLHAIRDLNDNVLTFTANGISSNAGSLSVLFQRDAQGRITQIIDPAGNVYGYTYDGVGDLTQVTLPTVGSTPIEVEYTYGQVQDDLAHYFLTARDPRGTIAATMVYYTDPQDQANYGRLQRVTDAGGNPTNYTYDLATNTTTITNPDNGVVRIHYDAMGYVLEETNPLNQTTHYTYDENHNLRAEVNPLGQTTSYDYNDQGHRTAVTNALGQQVITIAYNQYGGPTTLTDALGQVRNIQYDNRFNPNGATDSLGTIGGYTWNLQGNPTSYTNGDGETTSYTYNAYGQKVSETNAEGETTTYTYDLFGRTLSVTNAENETTSYTYDALGRMQTVTDPLGHITRFEYDPNGNRTAIVDPLNHRTEYTYNLLNQVTTVRYADLTTMTYEYDWRGNVTHITDATNRHTRYGYDQAGRRTAMTVAADTPSAGTTFYFYDGAGRLEREQDPLGHSTVYTYDPVGRLTRVTDAMGHHTDYVYNAANQLERVINADNYTTRYEYDVRGRVTDIHNPDTSIVHQVFDGAGRMTARTDETNITTAYVYDNAGRLISTTAAAGETQALTTAYVYDNVGRRTSVTTAYGTGLAATTSYAYLDDGSLDIITDPLGQTTDYDYNAAGQRTGVTNANGYVTNYEYDTMGRVEYIRYPLISSLGQRPTVHSVYDAAGRLFSRTDPAGRVTQYNYDPAGRMSEVTTAYGTSEAATTTYAYNVAGQLIQMTDPRGAITTYGYDPANRQTTVTRHLNATTTYTTTTQYTNTGQVDTVTDANNHVTNYDYNNRGWLVQTTFPDGTATRQAYDNAGRMTDFWDHAILPAVGHNTHYVYDPDTGRLDQVSTAYGTADVATTFYDYDAAWRQTDVTNPRGYITHTTYDNAGRMDVATTAYGTPDAIATNYDYDDLGQLIRTTAANGHVTRYEYDEMGRQTAAIDGNQTNSPRTQQVYDVAGQITDSIDQGGQTTHYTYDPAGRLGTVTLAYGTADAATTSYLYYDDGQLERFTDANGHFTRFEYDALGRLTDKYWADETPANLTDNPREQFTYDGVGNQLSHRQPDNSLHSFTYDVMDRLDTASYAGEFVYDFDYTLTGMRDLITEQRNGSTTWSSDYAYDAQDRVTSVTTPNGTVSYTYDPNGNRAAMTTPSGTTSYLYNGNDQLTQVTAPMGQTNLTYTNVGLPDTLTYPNGIVKDYSYDDRDRLNGVSYYPSTDPQYFLASYNYTLDAAGNRTRVDELGGNYVEWDYDNAYRLTDETFYTSGGTPVYDANYTYDDTGNRLTETVDGQTTTYSYNALDQMTSAGTVQYDYDGRGNLGQITDGSDITTLDYDALDRLEDVILPDSTHLTYTYDPDGRRVQQVAGTQETNYLWDEYSAYGDVILETDGTGAALSSYTLAGTQLISQTRGGVTSYYLQDGQGSTRALANASGVLTDAYSYTAFGTIYNQSGSTLNSYLYTGQQFDSLTGLYSLRARYYDPNVGRFLSQDTYPVDYQYPIELNRYGYSANSPINLSDPSGLQTTLEHTFAHGPLAENQSNVWKYVVGVAALFCFIIFMISLYTEQYIPFCGVYPLLKEVGDLLTKSKPDLSIWEEFMNGGMKWPKLPGEGTCLQYIAICVALGWHLYDAATNNNPQGNDTEEQTQPQPETGTGTQYKPGPGRCSIPQGTRSGAAGTVIGAKLQRVFHREVGWDFTTSESPLIPYPNGSHGEPDFVIYYNDNGEKTRQRPAALAEIYDIKPITYWEQDRLLGDVMFQLLKYINYFPKSYAKLAVGGKKFDPNGWVFRSPYYRRDEVLVLRTYYSSVEGVIFYECLQGQNLPRPTHDW